MDFEQALLEALLGKNGPSVDRYENTNQAEEELRAYLQRPAGDMGVGDRVERNEIGRKTYSVPAENQAAICVEKYDDATLHAGRGEKLDMLIAVAHAKGVFKFCEVDSKCFRKVGSNTANIFDFKKGK